MLRLSGPVWQEESFDHVLRSDESLKEKCEYIRQNPVRKGLVMRREEYRSLWVGPDLGLIAVARAPRTRDCPGGMRPDRSEHDCS